MMNFFSIKAFSALKMSEQLVITMGTTIPGHALHFPDMPCMKRVYRDK